MGFTWALHGLYMGFYMGFTWALHGLYMGFTWALHGLYMGPPWTLYGLMFESQPLQSVYAEMDHNIKGSLGIHTLGPFASRH